MATYLVGDIQGCFDDLKKLLHNVGFDAERDHLYLAGDLVARGPDSLSVLRFVKSLGSHGHTVLGNHDLHLLAVSEGIMPPKGKDKTLPILEAEDRDELLAWLRAQPLLIHRDHSQNGKLGFIITHAGIPPSWDLDTAKHCAREVEAILQSDDYLWLLKNMYANQPALWSENLAGIERYRYIINALTRMRFCEKDGSLDMACKLPPHQAKESGLKPWFEMSERKPIQETLVFGHWAALGGIFKDKLVGLDTGCVWGGAMTMMRWEDGQLFATPCPVHAGGSD